MSNIKKELENYPDISFINDLTLEELKQKMIEDFQKKYREETGREKKLGLGDPSRLILYAAALQLYQSFQYVERAGRQSFLKYAYGDFLDNLGALKGIVRSEGKASKTIMRFVLSESQKSAVVIPIGTRCTAGDGVYFYTTQTQQIAAGDEYVDVAAECAEKGDFADGYEVGKICILVDGIPYVGSVTNISETDGGAGKETDESLAERIYLAPSSYSTAGPDDAYVYWVKTFNNAVTDVKITSPQEGVVDIRVITGDGEIPENPVVQDLQEKIAQKDIRPLTDKVVVSTPEVENYNIDLTYWINESDKNQAAAIQERVEQLLSAYEMWQREKIGRDINPSKLMSFIMQAGAKRVEIREPVFAVIQETGIAISAGKNIVFGGVEDD